MQLELTDEEELALAAELKRAITQDRYPLSLRVQTLKGILAKLEPPAPVAAAPSRASKPEDRPRAALATMKRRRRG